MESEDEIISIYGQCQCCLTQGYMKCMWKEYNWEGNREVYGEMIMEIFGLSWESTDISQEYICDSCVMRLRVARRFRNMFVYDQDENENGVKSEIIQIQNFDNHGNLISDRLSTERESSCDKIEYLEAVLEEYLDEERDEEYIDDGIEYLEEDAEALEKLYGTVLRDAKQTKSEPGRKKTPAKSEKKKSETPTIHEQNKKLTREKHEKFVEEIQNILTLTTSIPFKVYTSRYYCAYCFKDGPWFEDPEDLKEHTLDHVDERITAIEGMLTPFRMNETLRLDVSKLSCVVCHTYPMKWTDMFEHFKEIHGLEFVEAPKRLIPFCLDTDLRCALCQQQFGNFQHLDRHMNVHYNNYMCAKCGETFISATRLKEHTLRHRKGRFECDQCDRVFQQKSYRRKHIAIAHKGIKMFKCKYCYKSYASDHIKHRHIVRKHKDKIQVITCEICGKEFSLHTYYVSHKRQHLQEKKFQCEYCSKYFNNKSEMKYHIYRHAGLGEFICVVCKRRYVTSKELKDHVVKAHRLSPDIVTKYK